MNVNLYNTTVYEYKSNWTLGENEPNTNPIKPNLRKAQMNVNSLITKDYRKKDDFAVRKNKPNSNPIKPNTKPIKANTSPKQTQNKPNTNPIKANFKLEANLSLRERRSLRVGFSESSNRGPISNSKRIYP